MRCLSNDVEVTTPRALRAVLVASGPKGDESEPTVSLLSSVADALASALAALRDDSVPGMRAVVDAGEIDTAPAVAADDPGIRRALAVFRASRPRQLLVTGAAVDLLAGPMADLELVDRGVHRLHGFDRPVRVFSGRGPSLSDAEPRTIDTVATSVPVPTSPLIGREELLADLAAAIRSERIVTLTGTGGSGKTRLSIEVAAAIAGAFDAVHWVDLSAVTSGGGVIDEVAAVIGLHGGRSTSLLDRIAHRLRGESSLLVFDNAEHLIEATATVGAPLLHRCPGLRIMVTSREALGIEGEVVRSVPPLELPTGSSADAIASSEAGVFLVDRLRRAGLRLVPDESNAALIHRICVRLDGIPLALELAAARGATLSLEDLAAQLDGRFSRMSATRRDAVPRQRTLDASVRWSHDLLTADEQTVFRRLAVFSGWFRPSDAEAIIGDDADGFDLVSRLVGQSLIVRRADGCLRLLETVRSFAEDRLDESGEALATRNRHVQWLLDVSRRIEPLFDGPDPSQAVAETRAHLADLRAALIHCESARDAANMWTLLARLVNYFWYQGNLDEALDWCARAAQVDDGTDPRAAAAGRVAAALLATSRGDHAEIVAATDQAIRAAIAAGDRRSEGRARVLAGAHLTWSDPTTGSSAIAEASVICSETGDVSWAVWAGCGAALALTFLGRPLEVIAALDAAERTSRRLDVRRLMMEVLARRCIAEYQLGRWGECHTTVQRGRSLAEGFAHVNVTACFDAIDAMLATETGQATDAAQRMNEAITRHLREGELQFLPWFISARADALTATGAPADATTLVHTVREHPGLEWAAIYRHWLDHSLANALLELDQRTEARSVAQRLVDDATTIGNRLDAARGSVLLARLDLYDGEILQAERRAHDALSTLVELGAVPAALTALQILIHTDELLGRSTRATAVAERLTAARNELLTGNPPDLAPVVELVRRSRGERGRPSFGWDSLTPAERNVVRLLADGLTNPEIAARLVMGRTTVKTHVSSALRKLDLTSRTQLATEYRARSTR
jgi:predicted ATPase/DNA-binding CsgD family transcriptional regulator